METMKMTELLNETTLTGLELRPLRENMDGEAVGPLDADWDEARQAWNLAVDQRPAAVALPKSALDVVAVVAFAREHGLRIAPQGTGHGAAALGDLSGTILLKTSRMRGVEIYPKARIARVEAGAIWIDVVEAAAEHGLAALAGSSPDVGVVGYTLGGGLSWLARKHGIGANQVTAIEGVTAAGEFFRTDRDNEPDLFWALRGGGGSFAIVTAIEFNLFPIEEVYAGILWFPVERAAEILKVWRAWTEDLPDEMTSVGRILQFPPSPEIPEPVRGRSFVVVEAIWLGEESEGERLLGPLRGLGPIMDTIAPMPIAELSRLHMDPEGPAPGLGDGGVLSDVDDDLIDTFVEHVVGTPILSAEIRHLGGAVARRSSQHGAIDAWEAPYIAFALGMAPTPEFGTLSTGS
ncbi:MAG: FAD-binding oxidoreductase [Gaiellaceae bacterium]